MSRGAWERDTRARKKSLNRQATQAIKQSNQDTTCITSIDVTVKVAYGHTEAVMEISRGIIVLTGYCTDQRFKYKPCL